MGSVSLLTVCVLVASIHALTALAAESTTPVDQSFLNGPFSLLNSETWSIPKELSSQLADLKAPLVPVMLMGVSRSGKSLLLNLFARYLLENGFASSSNEARFFEPHSLHSFPFGVSSEMTRCSVGINAVILKRIVPGLSEDESGYFILMDAEGSDNGNRKIVSKILGIARHLTNSLIFVDDNRFDRALDALGRLVAYGLKSSQAVTSSGANGEAVPVAISKGQTWPRLVMVLNKVLETLPLDDRAFFREQIAQKEDDDDATNGLRALVTDLFVDMEFITVPHNQTLKRLVEEEGVASLAQLDFVGAAAPAFMAKFRTLAEHLLRTASPLVLHRQATTIATATADITAPAQLPVNGKMFTAHLTSLLEKSKSIYFPDSNYLQQIVGVACAEIKQSHLEAYEDLLGERGLTPGAAGLGRFNHSRQVEMLHAELVGPLLAQFDAAVTEYHGGCAEQQTALSEHLERNLAGMRALLQPVGNRQETRHTLMARRTEESIAGVVNLPNSYFSASSASVQAGGADSRSVADAMFARSLDSVMPSTHCNVSVTLLEYSTMRVAVRNITILGNGVELAQTWRLQEDPAVVIASRHYSYVNFTAQWMATRMFLCVAAWLGACKMLGALGALVALVAQFVPANSATELRKNLEVEAPVCAPLLSVLEAVVGAIAVYVEAARVHVAFAQSAPGATLILLALGTHDMLVGKHSKYLAFGRMAEHPFAHQHSGPTPSLSELVAAIQAAAPELIASAMEKLSRVSVVGVGSTDILLELSFAVTAVSLVVLAGVSAILLVGCVVGQMVTGLYFWGGVQSAVPKQVACSTPVSQCVPEKSAPSLPVQGNDETVPSAGKRRSPVASVNFHMEGLRVSPANTATAGNFKGASSPVASTPSDHGSGGSDFSLQSVDSTGSPVPLHELLLQIQQHSAKKPSEESAPVTTATPNESKAKRVAPVQVPAARALLNRRRSTGSSSGLTNPQPPFPARRPVGASRSAVPVFSDANGGEGAGNTETCSPFLANIINQSRSGASPLGSSLFGSPMVSTPGVLTERSPNVSRSSLCVSGVKSKANKQNTTKMLRNLLGEL